MTATSAIPPAVLRTTCNRDCPDACAILAHVEDGRVVRLQGDPAHPVTRGFLCYRTDRFVEARQYAEGRVVEPLARRSWLERMRTAAGGAGSGSGSGPGSGSGSGSDSRAEAGAAAAAGAAATRPSAVADDPFVPLGWDEALDHLGRELLRIRAESGPAAILHYRSGGSLGLLKPLADYLFERFGPTATKRGDICSGAGDAAHMADFGDEDSHDLDDLAHAHEILLWGKNPHVSNVHLLPRLLEAKRRGAGITLVDPVHHRGVGLASLFVQPRPGGDLALALGMLRLLFDEGRPQADAESFCEGVPELRQLARSRPLAAWLDDADVSEPQARALLGRLHRHPCAIQVGWGMQRRSNGGAIVRALSALSALTGNLGIPGGGVSFYYKRRGAFDLSFIRGEAAAPRTALEPLLGRALLEASDPPYRAVWVTAGNPVAMLPDSATVARALETRELLVVTDSFLTDTARRAHVVLPVTTMLEDDDLVGAYGHHYLGSVRPVVEPPPGVRTDLAVLQGLAARLGLGDALAGSARDWKERLLRKVAPLGATLEAIEAGPVRNPLAPRVLFEGRRFPTPSGKMRLLTELPPEPRPLPGEGKAGGFELWLMSNSTERSQSSQWSAARSEHASRATVHPDVAASLGLADGDRAVLESPIGRLDVTIALDRQQRRDVVIVPKGGWFDDGQCANALIPARATDIGEGAAYLDARVRLVRGRAGCQDAAG